MITFRTISASKRRFLFLTAAATDIASRVFAAGFQYDLVFGSNAAAREVVTMSAATGLAVPAIALPVVLSPLAYLVGQVFVLTEAHYVRLVSVAFMFGSFLSYETAPGLSVLLTVLAYLVLASGMLRQR